MKKLLAEWHLDSGSDIRLRLVKSDTERFIRHMHDYFELFLVLSGKATHALTLPDGEKNLPLSYGDFVLIRPSDIHDYVAYDNDFSFINFAFSEETLRSLLCYLGDGFDWDVLLSGSLPPCVKLSDADTKSVFYKLTSLTDISDNSPSRIKAKARAILAELIFRFLTGSAEKNSHIPLWLEHTYEAMKQPKNFIKGKEKLFSLAGKTREHTTRCMQRYYGVTPCEYVSDLRLAYAAGLLKSSNYSVTDICFECGFQNVSWFYTSFEKKFGVTPLGFREGT